MSDDILIEVRSVQKRALVMELETVAVPTRRLVFETLRSLLSEEGIPFDETGMLRHGLHSVPARIAAELAAAYGLKPAVQKSLGDRVAKALMDHFASPAAVLRLGLDRVLSTARGHGAAIGLISWQPEPAAAALVSRVGLDQSQPLLLCFPQPDHEFPGADNWLRLLKAMGRQPQDAVALCDSRAGCRSALTAGLRVVAVPDEFTLHQDFGGADALVHHAEDVTAEMLFGRL